MSLLIKKPFGSLYQFFKRLSTALARINTALILSIIFFLAITPAGLLKRAYIKFKRVSPDDTRWHKKTEPVNFERQF